MTDALYVLQRMQEKYRDKKKKFICVPWILRRHLIEFHEK